MIQVPYNFKLDLKNKTSIPYMEYFQSDVETAQMNITILNDSKVVNLEGHTVICNIKKSDDLVVQNLAEITKAEEGLITVNLTTQSLASIGENHIQLTLFEGHKAKSTHEFKYYVKSSLLDTEVPVSSNEYGLLNQLIANVQVVENILNTSENARVQAETNRVNEFSTIKNEYAEIKDDLGTVKKDLVDTNTKVNDAEILRVSAEDKRETLKTQLVELQSTLETLKTNLNNLENEVSANEIERIANENIRIALKDNLETLETSLNNMKSELETLGTTLSSNETNRNTTFNDKVGQVDTKITLYDAVIADIERRFSLLTTAVQQASEVINARTSTIRNKTFIDLNARIAEIEKDILTSQSTSVVDSVVPYNVLANAMDGATDIWLKGQTLVNSVKNGNFANGTSGWVAYTGNTINTNNNTLTVTSTGVNVYVDARQITNIPCTNGRKVYVRAKFRVLDSTNCNNLTFAIYGSLGAGTILAFSQVTPTSNTWYEVRSIITLSDVFTGTVKLEPFATYTSNTTASGKVMEVQDVMALDLTSLGLESKTADEINAMLPSYFEGIASIEGDTVVRSIGENLLTPNFVGGNVTDTGKLPTFLTTSVNRINQAPIKISATKSYTITLSKNPTYFGTNIFICFSKNGVYMSAITLANYQRTFSIPSGCDGFYIQINATTDALAQEFQTTTMLNEGSVVKPYTQYRESKIKLSDYIKPELFPLRSLPNNVADEYIPQGNKVVKRIKDFNIDGNVSGIGISSNNGTNTRVFIPVTSIIPNMTTPSTTNSMLFNTDGTLKTYGDTSTGDITKFEYLVSSTRLYFNIAGAFTTIPQVVTHLNNNPLKFIYQLATPQEHTLDRPINLQIFKNGSMIVEPSKLYPKLSYSYPTNLGRSIESIVSNLAWIKDNQQFIMSYLLNLDTRLTLGGH